MLDLFEQKLNKELKQLENYHSTIENEESKFLQDFNNYENQLNRKQEQRMMQNVKAQTVQKLNKKLQKTSFLNEVFKISAIDEIATIGGLRLGRSYYLHVNGNSGRILIGNDRTTMELHNTGSNEDRFNRGLSFLFDCLNSLVKNLNNRFSKLVKPQKRKFVYIK